MRVQIFLFLLLISAPITEYRLEMNDETLVSGISSLNRYQSREHTRTIVPLKGNPQF